ncbi:MAG: hypothetical protein LBU61_04615 [Coriobacteriales bacterium]|nr:hypothetical protein [Coriobacteriales bacterium]
MQRILKSILTILVITIVIASLSLVACDDSTSKSGSGDGQNTEQPSNGDANNPFGPNGSNPDSPGFVPPDPDLVYDDLDPQMIGRWIVIDGIEAMQVLKVSDSWPATVGIYFGADGTAGLYSYVNEEIVMTDNYMEWSTAGNRFEIKRDGEVITFGSDNNLFQGTFSLEGIDLKLTLDTGTIIGLYPYME